MKKHSIPLYIQTILNNMDFIVIATSDNKGAPSAVSKFIVKVEGSNIYLVDFIKGITWKNIKANPQVSLSVLDEEKLMSYQINGSTEILYKGEAHSALIKELIEKETDFSTQRIIEGVRRGKRHESFTIPHPSRVLFLKIKVKKVVELGPAAEIENVKK